MQYVRERQGVSQQAENSLTEEGPSKPTTAGKLDCNQLLSIAICVRDECLLSWIWGAIHVREVEMIGLLSSWLKGNATTVWRLQTSVVIYIWNDELFDFERTPTVCVFVQTVKFTILPHMIALIVLRCLLKRAVVEQSLDSLTYHPAAVEGKEKKTFFFQMMH